MTMPFERTMPDNYDLHDICLEERISSGAHGVVFKAFHMHLERTVAVKLFVPDYKGRGRPKELDRFDRERQALFRLDHPSIVSVYEANMNGDLPYIVEEYVSGISLQKFIEDSKENDKRCLLPEILVFLRRMSAGVDYMHKAGVIHRDIKPSNIILRDGKLSFPVLIDFSICLSESTDFPWQTDHVASPQYAAPEQLSEGGHITHRSDLFGLAAVCYELATGRPPLILSGSIQKQIATALSSYVKPVTTYSDGFNDAIDVIFFQALSRDPAYRFESAEQFFSILRREAQLLHGSSRLNGSFLRGR